MTDNRTRNSGLLIAAVMTTAVVLSGCGEENTYVKPPPAKVTVAEPLKQEITDYLEFTGITDASAQVEVPARVPGVLQSMHFVPGTHVEQGELLFRIDPDRYEADVAAALADLKGAEARQLEASKRLKRATTLIKRGNIAQAKVDEAEADERTASAEILVRKAKLRQARIDLGYTKIIAPISGRVGRNDVDIGNLVGEDKATVLTRITNSDPIYAYFNLNERDLLHVLRMWRERVKESGIDPSKEPGSRADLKVELGLADEDGYPHQGVFDFAESSVDSKTGTMQLRATFENKEKPPLIVSGLFVRVRLPISKRQDMLLVTERAIGFDQTGQFVLVINSKNVVEKRSVRLGQLIDGLRVMEAGIKPGDRIVVAGLQRARPGATVDPTVVDMASLTASALSAAAEKEAEDRASKGITPDKAEKRPDAN